MFSITCETCAARIRVRSVAAIDQVLACPKCGVMIRVQPPAGWEAPPGVELPQRQAAGSAAEQGAGQAPASRVDSADFADIDALLAASRSPPAVSAAKTHAQPSARQGKSPARGASQPSAPPAPRPDPSVRRDQADPSASPPAPPAGRAPQPSRSALVAEAARAAKQPSKLPLQSAGQWTPAATQRRQRWILWSAIGLAAIVVVGLLVVYTMTRGKPQSVVQKNNSPVQPEPISTDEPAVDDDSSTDAVVPDEEPPVSTDPPTDDSTLDEGPPGESIASDLPTVEPPPGEALVDAVPDPAPPADVVPEPVRHSQLFDGFARLSAMPPPRVDEMLIVLSKLDTTVAELRSAASRAVTRQWVGIPPFFVERQPAAQNVDLDALLETRIASIEYRDIDALAVVEEMALLLNLPITVDDPVIRSDQLPWMKRITLSLEDATIEDVLQAIAAELELAIRPAEHGMLLTLPGIDEVQTRRYALPPLREPSPEAYLRFAEAIPQLVAAGTWSGQVSPEDAGQAQGVLVRPTTEAEAGGEEAGEGEMDDPIQLEESQVPAAAPVGEIRIVEGELEVSHTLRVHLALEEFLGKLQAAHQLLQTADDADAQAMLVTRWSQLAPQLAKPLQLAPSVETHLGRYFLRLAEKEPLLVLVDWESLSGIGWGVATTLPGTIRAADWSELFRQVEHATGFAISARSTGVAQLTTVAALNERVELEIYSVAHLLAKSITPDQLVDALWEVLGWHWQQGRGQHLIYEPNYQCLIVVAPQPLQRRLEAVLQEMAE